MYHKERVAELLKNELSLAIMGNLRDSRVPGMVTVTQVSLTPDMRNATVYFSVFGDEKEQKSALIGLNHAAPFLQNIVAKRVNLKRFPKICFKFDNNFEKSMAIEKLLSEIRNDLV